VIGRDREAETLRLHPAESWRVGTLAPQLGVHPSTVRRVGDPDEVLRCPTQGRVDMGVPT
jgi:hypothetical protein